MVEAAARWPGYGGLLLIADRATAAVGGARLWEMAEVMEASDRAYYQTRVVQALSAGAPRRRLFQISALD